MITIIDYGMGNLRSVQKAFELYCSKVRISSSYEDILTSDKIVLPGVGSFGVAMQELKKRRLTDAILDSVNKEKPFLGICLGLQLLFSESEEGGKTVGLGVLKGTVKKFQDRQDLKIPHMGWNTIEIRDKKQETGILRGVQDGSYMYFVHSYYVEPEDKSVVLCETEYGDVFTSGICKDNICAFQFHPEKSQTIGLNIIRNFVKC